MVNRNKSNLKFKLKESSYQAQWHGAVEQIKRIIEEIIPYTDEAFDSAESFPAPQKLQKYITQVSILYNNVECIIPAHDKNGFFIFHKKLIKCKRTICASMSQKDYFLILDGANWLDLKLRSFLQDRALLYRIFQRDVTPSNIKELMKYVPEDKVDAMIKKSPLLAKYFKEADDSDDFDKYLEETD